MKTGISFALALLSLLPATTSPSWAAEGWLSGGLESTPVAPAPALRAYITETMALNVVVVPDFRIGKKDSAVGPLALDLKTWSGGLRIALLPLRRTTGQVKHGPMLEARPAFTYVSSNPGPTLTTYVLGTGLGWDVEYFVARVPGLSLGANAIALYEYNWLKEPGEPDNYTHTVGLRGTILNVRYYF
jgi:hypothetical protein